MPEPCGDHPPRVEFRDRSRRLVAFGILVTGCGAVGLLLGLAHLLLPLAAAWLPSAGHLDPAATAMGALLYGSLGAILVWIGVGSLRLRRWVRPLMLSVAWIWLIAGLIVTPLAASMADDLILLATVELEAVPSGLLVAVKVVLLSITVVAGVVLPALLVWAYRDPDVGRTCRARHPEPAWTDRCPLAVLGLSVCLGLTAVVALPALPRPVVPVFGYLVTGWPGSVLVLGGAALMGYLAWSTYRLQPAGWWATTVLLVVLGASTVVTFAAVDAVEIYRAMGYPEEILAAWSGSAAAGRPVLVGSAVVLTLVSLVYMARIRRHFSPGSSEVSA